MSLKYSLLAAAVASLAAAGAGGAQVVGEPVDSSTIAAVQDPLRLEVRLGERTLYVLRGDSTVKTYPVAVGKEEHPTPRGEFHVSRVIWNPRWVPPKAPWARNQKPKGPGDPDNPMGRVKMFFQEPDYYLHGTNNEGSLGRAESHGCVRMANRHVVELARMVMEHGGEPRAESWFQQILNRVRRTQSVRLSQPVPLRIVP